MIELVWDAGFKRSYKKRISGSIVLRKKFWDALLCSNRIHLTPYLAPISSLES
jgi:hypothetical protein